MTASLREAPKSNKSQVVRAYLTGHKQEKQTPLWPFRTENQLVDMHILTQIGPFLPHESRLTREIGLNPDRSPTDDLAHLR